jgi:hypothetical protein
MLEGDIARAQAGYVEAVTMFRDLGTRWYTLYFMLGLTATALAQGQFLRATTVFGAVQAHQDALGVVIRPSERQIYDEGVAALRGALGETTFAHTLAEGRALSLDAAIALSLAVAAAS